MAQQQRGVSLALAEFILKQHGREFTMLEAVQALPEIKADAVRYRLALLASRGELQTRIRRSKTVVYSSKADSGAGSGGFRCSPLLMHAMGRISRARRACRAPVHAEEPRRCPLWNADASPEEARRWARSLIETAAA